GYVQEEFFIAGTAQAYVAARPWGDDGRWDAVPNPDATAPYTTRLLVRRPTDPARFNGTVLVEWMNVSGGLDAEPDWIWTHEELVREGYAYVGVSAQRVGTNFLRGSDPGRYGTIAHPGDSFSYDMFSQAGRAVLAPAAGGPQPLGDLTPAVRALLADGESQSAGRMFTYVDAVHPLARVYDGFHIHSTGGGANLSQPAEAGSPPTPTVPDPTLPRPRSVIRTDLREPVLVVNTESDVARNPAVGPSAIHDQPDGRRLRVWELTGTAHVDRFLLDIDCGGAPINDGPQAYALRAAVHALARWVRTGIPAPRGDRFAIEAGAVARDPVTGLAVGGIRLPDVVVPNRTLSGFRPPGAIGSNPFCFLAGSSDPWDGDADPWDGQPGLDPSPTPEPDLAALYPDHATYVFRYTLSTLASAFHGFVRPRDVPALVQQANQAPVP
ncbi:MAG TPA: alpha/beta hydrolase domain-containing protein, partial [Acidimicrobiales bacterium]